MAVDGDNNPVVVYLDQETGIPMMLTLNPATAAWNLPVKLSNSKASNGNITIAFDSNGVGYVIIAMTDAASVYKYEVFRYAMDTDED